MTSPTTEPGGVEYWNAAERRSFERKIESIAVQLEELAAAVREKGRDAAGDTGRPGYFTGLAASIQNQILWGVANMNLDGLTARAGTIEVTAASIRHQKPEEAQP